MLLNITITILILLALSVFIYIFVEDEHYKKQIKLRREKHLLTKAHRLAEADVNKSCYVNYYMPNGYVFKTGPYRGVLLGPGYDDGLSSYITAHEVAKSEIAWRRPEVFAQCVLSGNFFYPERADRIEIVTEDSAIQKESKQ